MFTLTINSSDDDCYDNLVAQLNRDAAEFSFVFLGSVRQCSECCRWKGRSKALLMKLEWNGDNSYCWLYNGELRTSRLFFVWVRGS
jgi:hypothetical protein